MSHRSTRHRARGLAGGLLLAFSASATAAQALPSQASTFHAPFWNALLLEPQRQDDLWQRMRDNFQWQSDAREPRVQKWIAYYQRHPANVTDIAESARPWLYWVVSEIERRDMPGEIALLPFIESAYDPTARHPGGASGMWQFMPGTGDALGLRRNGLYDGRLDVVASTRAALDYIQQQADQWYDGDIELSLAAYNAGAGRVNRARRQAVASGRPGDYWHLKLPRQTMNYVPKLIALSRIVAAPDRYGIELPAINNDPAFARVPVDGRLSLSRLADMAGISYRRLKALNPALLRGATLSHRSPDLLVPRAQKEVLEKLLAKQQALFENSDRYRVRQGDSLSLIAARHSVSVGALKRYNGLHGNLIRTGQVLRIPAGTDSADRKALVYRVRLGDSLSGIAARHDVSPADILRWNQLEAGQYLQPGQRLTLYAQ